LILKEIEKLGKVSSSPAASRKSPPTLSPTAAENPTPAVTGPQKGYEYKVAAGDTLSIIAKAYSRPGHQGDNRPDFEGQSGVEPEQPQGWPEDFHPGAGEITIIACFFAVRWQSEIRWRGHLRHRFNFLKNCPTTPKCFSMSASSRIPPPFRQTPLTTRRVAR